MNPSGDAYLLIDITTLTSGATAAPTINTPGRLYGPSLGLHTVTLGYLVIGSFGGGRNLKLWYQWGSLPPHQHYSTYLTVVLGVKS